MAIVWAAGLGQQLFKNVSAPKVYKEIDEIGESATPQQIVDRARDPQSELHKCFEWDDSKAAESWRRQQARQVRFFLRMESDEHPEEPQVHALHFTFSGEGYKTAEKVFQREDEYAMLLQRAKAELIAFQKKYEFLSGELDFILGVIDEMQAKRETEKAS